MKNKLNIAVLGGGYTSEREISLNSAKQIFANLSTNKCNPFLVDVSYDGMFCITDGQKFKLDLNDFSTIINGIKIKFDFVFIVIHGSPGEDGKIQGYFDILNIPYSSCGVLTSAVTFDKISCKKFLQNNPQIFMAKSIVIDEYSEPSVNQIIKIVGLPCFVKPNTSGSSYGVTKVYEKENFINAVNHARTEDKIVLVEEFIKGIEVSCGAFKTKNTVKVLPVTEISTKKDYFDTQAKYEIGLTEEITPARISKKIIKLVQKTTLLIYKELRCKGIVRVDFIIKNEIPYFLEVNSIPGMSEASIIPKQILAEGLSLTDVLWEIVENEMNTLL